jgi:tetratricopeptide (TPR) repeat protein
MPATRSFLRSEILLGIVLLSITFHHLSLALPQGPPGGQGPATGGPPANPQRLVRVTLKGQIRAADGGAIPVLAMVYLRSQNEDPVVSKAVDISGDFEFTGITPAVYHLVVTAENYVTYRQTMDLLTGPAEYYTVNVVLVPAPATEATAGVRPALTDEAAPKSARKEFEKGSRALSENKNEVARSHLQKAVSVYPCYARAQIALADLDLAENKPDDAEKNFKKAVECDGGFLKPFSQLGQLYYKQKKFQASDEILSRGLRLFPSSWLLHYQHGAVLFDEGKYPEAVRAFENAAASNPDMPAEFHAHFANAYLKIGNSARALVEIETYLRLDPNGKYSTGARQIAQALKNQGETEGAASGPSIKP